MIISLSRNTYELNSISLYFFLYKRVMTKAVNRQYPNIVYSQKSRNLAPMIKRVYIETVFGGNFDEEFSVDTGPFFDSVRKGEVTIIVSDVLEAELLGAPVFVKQLLDSLPEEFIERIRLS